MGDDSIALTAFVEDIDDDDDEDDDDGGGSTGRRICRSLARHRPPPSSLSSFSSASCSPASVCSSGSSASSRRRVVPSSHRRVGVVVVTGPHNFHCRHRPYLPPSSRQPLLLPPTPPLQPSVDGWLLCCLLRRLPPNLSYTAFLIVRSSTLSPPAAGRRPLSPTFASRCPIHHLRRYHRWLVVAFSPYQAAYQVNHQAENVSSFYTLVILTYLE